MLISPMMIFITIEKRRGRGRGRGRVKRVLNVIIIYINIYLNFPWGPYVLEVQNKKLPKKIGGGGARLMNTALYYFNYLLDQLHASTCAILFLVPCGWREGS